MLCSRCMVGFIINTNNCTNPLCIHLNKRVIISKGDRRKYTRKGRPK